MGTKQDCKSARDLWRGEICGGDEFARIRGDCLYREVEQYMKKPKMDSNTMSSIRALAKEAMQEYYKACNSLGSAETLAAIATAPKNISHEILEVGELIRNPLSIR